MNYKLLNKNSQKEITNLFTRVFSSSEGDSEGQLIGGLASALSSGIDNEEIICFGAYEEKTIVGSIFFTRLRFNKVSDVYMLAPVAISAQHQGKGIGQALINYGLSKMKDRSTSVVVTYGDPSFYSKVSFQSLSEKTIQAPLKLSMPEGWLGQSLTAKSIPTIDERPTCVEQFNNPIYW